MLQGLTPHIAQQSILLNQQETKHKKLAAEWLLNRKDLKDTERLAVLKYYKFATSFTSMMNNIGLTASAAVLLMPLPMLTGFRRLIMTQAVQLSCVEFPQYQGYNRNWKQIHGIVFDQDKKEGIQADHLFKGKNEFMKRDYFVPDEHGHGGVYHRLGIHTHH